MLEQLRQYAYLMRLNKPIGILLLLWPTLWALWLSAPVTPSIELIVVFVMGVIVTRSAGCIINDIADRKVDGQVARTRLRPLVIGTVTVKQALVLFIVLWIIALCLAMQLNQTALELAFVGAGLMVIYPFLKRFTHLPQVGLGFAFAWGVPMAFAAQNGSVSEEGWFLFAATLVWVVLYDTLYAMTDRADDLKVGIKSTAILFAKADKLIIGLLQLVFLGAMWMLGQKFHLADAYAAGLVGVALLFLYQQFLIKDREPQKCFQAFLNNNWVGLLLFLGIAIS